MAGANAIALEGQREKIGHTCISGLMSHAAGMVAGEGL